MHFDNWKALCMLAILGRITFQSLFEDGTYMRWLWVKDLFGILVHSSYSPVAYL